MNSPPGLWPRAVLIALVRLYRLFFSAWLGNSCRFVPSCSLFALEALERHGAIRGGGLTVWRLLRCQPFCVGGHDPVPAASGRGAGLFTRLIGPGCGSPASAQAEPGGRFEPETTSKNHP